MPHTTPHRLSIDQLTLGHLIAADGLAAHLDAVLEMAARFLDLPCHRSMARIVLDPASPDVVRERAFGQLPPLSVVAGSSRCRAPACDYVA